MVVDCPGFRRNIIDENDASHSNLSKEDALFYLPPVETLLEPDGFIMDTNGMDRMVELEENRKIILEKRDALSRDQQNEEGIGKERSPQIATNSLRWTPGNSGWDHAEHTYNHPHQQQQDTPKKRGRPKSTRLALPAGSKRAPNLYSVITRATELSSGASLERQVTGLAPSEIFGSADALPSSYSWMSEKRGKKRKGLKMSGSPNTSELPQQLASPIMNSLTSDPVLMASLGMLPGDAAYLNAHITNSLYDQLESPKLPLMGLRSQSKPFAPPLAPLSVTDSSLTRSDQQSLPDPSEYFMDDLFTELFETGEPKRE